MKEKELRNLIDGHLRENLDLAGAKKLSDHLSENADARKLYLEMTDLHASLAVDETMWIEQPEWVEKEEAETITSFRAYIPWALAASVVFLLRLMSRSLHRVVGMKRRAYGSRLRRLKTGLFQIRVCG